MKRCVRLSTIAILWLLGQISAQAASGGPDGYGYSWVDSAEPGGPAFSWVDITATGQQIDVTTSPGATVALETPFVLYGSVVNSLRVSRHGYLSTLLSDPGDDSSADCPLPATPSSGGGDRLYPLHGNYASSAKAHYQYIPQNAHPANRCGAHVITWSNMVEQNHGNAPVQFQVLLFDNFDILYQYDTDSRLRGRFTTTGLQRAGSATDFHTITCDDDGTIHDELAVRILPERIGVNSTGDTLGGPGTTLRDALATASDGQRIQVSVTGVLTLSHPDPLLVAKSVAIELSDGETFFVIDAGGTRDCLIVLDVLQANHCFISGINFNNGSRGINTTESLMLHACHMAGCTKNADGAGILSNGTLYLTGSRFANNATDHGSGGAISAAQVFAWESEFEDNTTNYGRGGAVRIQRGAGSSAFKDCLFEENASGTVGNGDGGAIWAGTPAFDIVHELLIEDCRFERNSANFVGLTGSRGGALAVEQATLTARRCLFIMNNSAGHGGALYALGKRQRLEHCAFDSNTTDSPEFSGGAIAQFNGDLDLLHCSVVRNNNSAIFLTSAFDEMTSSHTLYADNENADGDETAIEIGNGFATVISLGQNLCDEDEPGLDASSGDIENTEALISKTKLGGVLLGGSPAIDAGTTLQADSDTDFRGHPRQFGPKIDIGAYEHHGSVVVDTAEDLDTNPLPDAVPAGSPISLRQALARVGDGGTVTFAPALSGQVIDIASLTVSQCEVHIDASSLAERPTLTAGDTTGQLVMQNHSSVTGMNFTNFVSWPINLNGGGITITDCDLFDNGRVIRTEDNDSGGQQILRIERCRIYDNGPSSNSLSHPFRVGDSVSFDLIDSVIENTEVEGDGGGILFAGRVDVDIENSSIVRNTCSGDGGAFHIGSGGKGGVRITNSTISSNTAGGTAGGIFANDVGFAIKHSTIAANQCSGGTCAIATTGSSSIEIDHTIFQGNGQGFNTSNFGNLVTSTGHNIIDNDDLASPQSTDLVERSAHIAPLGYYSDDGAYLMPVHALLAISPAIDAGQVGIDNGGDTPPLDQRKANRIRNGTGSSGIAIDIGAFEAGTPLFVTNTDDSGPGSLRQTIADTGGGNIANRVLFDPSLDGAETVISSQILIPSSLQIDATALPNGFTLNGNGSTRVLRMNENAHLAVHAITLREGFGASGTGGAGYRQTQGHSVFSNCAIIRNNGDGGAGAYFDAGSCYLLNCTIAQNSGSGIGSALNFRPDSTGRIEHCSIVANISGARGNLVLSTAHVTSKYTLFSDNTVSGALDTLSWDTGYDPSTFSLGHNIADENMSSSFFSQPTDSDNHATLPLSQLTDNGGWCWSVAPTGSPVSDAATLTDSPPYPTFDARGFIRRAGLTPRMDLGSHEAGAETQDSDGDGMPDWWESRNGLVVFSPNTSEAGRDPDGDGFTNLEEFQNRTDPLSPDRLPLPVITGIELEPGFVFIKSIGPAGTSVQLQISRDLQTWTDVGNPHVTSGSQLRHGISRPGWASVFYRYRKL